MVAFGGKKVRQMFGGNGLGHILAAAAVTLLVRLFSGPGPVLSPENENEDHGDEEERDVNGGEAPVPGKVLPVTIRWSNVTCSLFDKSSQPVSSRRFVVVVVLLLLVHRFPVSFLNAEVLFRCYEKLGGKV